MIVPEIAGSAAAELDHLRTTCDAAVAVLAASGAETLVVIGADRSSTSYRHPFHGSFRPWGVPVDVTVESAEPAVGSAEPAIGSADPLPLSLLVGGWLLCRAFRPAGPVSIRMATVAGDDRPIPVRRNGRPGGIPDNRAPDTSNDQAWRMPDDRAWALLAMGDGSACRGRRAPGYADPRAQPYDDGVAAALAGADAEALLGLNPALSAQLLVAGRASWQVLAAAVQETGGRWRGDLSYYAAPYGVGYFVASWLPA